MNTTTATKTTWTVTGRTETREPSPKDKGKEFETNHCHCSRYTVETADGPVSTDCGWLVASRFRQGHDAKLKSLLIFAGSQPDATLTETYWVGVGETRVITEELTSKDGTKTRTRTRREPVVATRQRPVGALAVALKHGFGRQVESGIDRQFGERTSKEAKAAKKQAPERKLPAEVKVGRWWQPVVGQEGEQFAYATKTGERKLAKAGAEVRA